MRGGMHLRHHRVKTCRFSCEWSWINIQRLHWGFTERLHFQSLWSNPFSRSQSPLSQWAINTIKPSNLLLKFKREPRQLANSSPKQTCSAAHVKHLLRCPRFSITIGQLEARLLRKFWAHSIPMSWWLSHHPNNILVRWERLRGIPFQKIARHFIIWNHWNQTRDVVAEHKQIKGLLLRMAGWLLCTAQTMDVQGPPNKLRNCGPGGNILIYEIRARLGLAWSWQKLAHRSWWGGSKRTNQAGKPGFSRVHTCIVGTSSHTCLQWHGI